MVILMYKIIIALILFGFLLQLCQYIPALLCIILIVNIVTHINSNKKVDDSMIKNFQSEDLLCKNYASQYLNIAAVKSAIGNLHSL